MISPDKNWQTYRSLQETLALNLRRQMLVAVCDDPSLCHSLVTKLDMEFHCNGNPLESGIPRWVTLELEVQDPNLARQIDRWHVQRNNAEASSPLQFPSSPPHPRRRKDDWMNVSPLDLSPDIPREFFPGFQFIGVEHLTRQPPTQQWAFLKNLEYIAQRYLDLAWEWNLLIWVPRPWLLSIQQSASKFWNCHTGLFEFAAEPIPSELFRDRISLKELANSAGSLSTLKTLNSSDRTSSNSPNKTATPVKLNPRKIETIAEIKEAIMQQNQALEVLENEAIARLDLLNDLGNLYWILSRKLENSEEALTALQQATQTYELALSHPQIHSQPQGYARLQNNLGIAYGELARHGNPVNALQRAIAAYHQALSYRQDNSDRTNLEDLQHYASTQNNLGTAYWNLAQHQDPINSLQQAIAAYQEALKYYNPDRDPLSYGMIQNNLGTAYWNLSQHEQSPDYLKLAIWSYQLALQYRTLENHPNGYAATQNNLGTTYWHLGNQTDLPIEERRENLHHCITAYEQAIGAINDLKQQGSIALSFDPFATHNNLGIALYQFAMTAHQTSPSPIASILDPLQLSLNHHIQAWKGWQNQPKLANIALHYLLQTLRALYNEGGIAAQNSALNEIPQDLLPDILNQL